MAEFDNPTLKSILEIGEMVRGGRFFMDSDTIRVGHAFQYNSYDADVKTFCTKILVRMSKADAPVEQIEAMRKLHFDRSIENFNAVADILEEYSESQTESFLRIDVYKAFLGDPESIIRQLQMAFTRSDSAIEKTRNLEFAIGCAFAYRDVPGFRVPLDAIIETGAKRMREMREMLAETGADQAERFFKAMAEAGAADAEDDEDPYALATEPPRFAKLQIVSDAVIVVPPYSAPTKSDRQRPRTDFHPISGQALPLIKTGSVFDHMSALAHRAPHLAEVYSRLLTDTATSSYARFKPTILVGEPGAGKSWSAREIGRVMGLPVSVYSCGGVADSTFGGTAAHWSTSGASVPLSFILQCRKANPFIVLDEIEKAGTGDHNGKLVDTLLSFLDRGNAAAYRDPALEMAVDLSHVNYILTANSLEGIRAPLRDRCRIIAVPNPGPEHVPVLVRGIIASIAADRGVDPRWFPPLAGDEMDVVIAGWGCGSIRRLRRVVETVLDGRDKMRGAY